jgi:hypothetical protein
MLLCRARAAGCGAVKPGGAAVTSLPSPDLPEQGRVQQVGGPLLHLLGLKLSLRAREGTVQF